MWRLAALALLAGCAAPPEILIVEGFVQAPPPPEYDRPYLGDLTVVEVPAEDVALTCIKTSQAHGGRMAVDNAIGCAIARDDFCIVVIPSTDTTLVWNGQPYPITASEILRHEVGHCNGWSHS